MNITELYIEDSEVPLLSNLPVVTNYAIADISDPSSRDSFYTLAIDIPSTPESDAIFEFIWDINISTASFNPNKKKAVKYKINGVTVLDGDIQLIEIVENKVKNTIIYKCNIVSKHRDLFFKIGESYLTDLSFSDYDHVLSVTNIQNSWSNTCVVLGTPTALSNGQGYVYGLADYGYAGTSGLDFPARGLRPCLFVKEMVDKIFTSASKTYTSTFFNTSFFKSLILPCPNILQLSNTDLLNNQCYVGQDLNILYSNNIDTLTYGGSYWTNGPAYNDYVIKLQETTISPFSDVGGIYNTTTGEATIAVSGDYTIKSNIRLTAGLEVPGGSGVTNVTHAVLDYSFNVMIQVYSLGSWATVAQAGPYVQTGFVTGSTIVFSNNCYVETTQSIAAGDKVRMVVQSYIDNCTLLNFLNNPLTSGSAQVNLVVDSLQNSTELTYSYLNITLTNAPYITEGFTVQVDQCIPKNIKQKDFLKSIINMFNLYLEVDANNSNNYIIEPRDDFYTGNVNDWTDKVDVSKDININPVVNKYNRYKFRYKEDSDYYNSLYQSTYNEPYGSLTLNVNTDFVNEEHNNELVFSPTPLIGNNENKLLYPRIFQKSGTEISPTGFNIRILIWGGLKSGYFNITSDIAPKTVYSTYPFIGHIDDPVNPTIDLSFGVPNEVFWNVDYIGTTYTTDNLYSIYHQSLISSIVNKDARRVLLYLDLNEVDIKNFSFRDKVFILNTNYYVNSINEFDLLFPKTTQVELLKL